MLLRRLFLASAVPGLVTAANWPRFRGADGAGLAVGAGALPESLDKPLWTARTPPGHSSPVVWEDRIFLTGAEGGARTDAGLSKVVDAGGRLSTLCLNRKNGRPYQPANSPASPSVVTDGRMVYAFFGDFGLLADSLNGKEVWRRPLGPFNNINGHGSSPMLAGDLLIMQCESGYELLSAGSGQADGKYGLERGAAGGGPVVFDASALVDGCVYVRTRSALRCYARVK